MKQNKKITPIQTHFIGVLPPDEIAATLEDRRRYMREKYGCYSGQQTPLHITLVPPFHLPEEFSLRDLAESIISEIQPYSDELRFSAVIENFDAFGDRTIFAKIIQDERWTKLRNKVLESVLNFIPNCTKKDRRPFLPHITIANRDIPSGVSKDVLEVFNESDFTESFEVDNVTIFERKNYRWEIAGRIEIN